MLLSQYVYFISVVFVRPNDMCYEEARAGSKNNCDIEDELDAVQQNICILIKNGKGNIILKVVLGSQAHYLNRNKKNLMLKITVTSCFML